MVGRKTLSHELKDPPKVRNTTLCYVTIKRAISMYFCT